MPIATINGTQLYYEIHGEGEPAVCMGGWGTYCHKDGRLCGNKFPNPPYKPLVHLRRESRSTAGYH